MAPLLGRGAVCLLALLWTVTRCAADPSADRKPDGDAANLLLTLVSRAVKEAVEPISAELSSVVTRLNGMDARMDLLMSRFDVNSDHISARVDLIHTRVNSVSLQTAELESALTTMYSKLEGELEAKLEITNSHLSSLQTGINSLKTDLDSHHASGNSGLNSLQTRLNSLESGMNSHHESANSSLNSLQTRLNTLESGMNSHHKSANSSLNSLQTRLNSLESGMNSNHASANSSLNSLQTRLDTLEAGMGSHHKSANSGLNALQTRLDTLESGINSNHASANSGLNGLQTRLDTLESGMNSNHESANSSLHSLQTRLDTLEAGMDSHHELANSNLNSLQTRLDTLEAGMDSHHKSANSSLNTLQTSLDVLKTGLTSKIQTANTQLESVSDQLVHLANYTQSKQNVLPPRDCSGLPVGSSSGVHLLQLSSDSPLVAGFCDMDTDGGGWTVFQRRADIQPREHFNRTWDEYRAGFGSLTGEFWWGLKKLRLLTGQPDRRYELRVDLEDFNSDNGHAVYQNVTVSSESDGYRLNGSGYTGNSGDSLTYPHFGTKFSTKDRDQDANATIHCANLRMGGWWYNSCYHANLNGLYLPGINCGDDWRAVVWYKWKGKNSCNPMKTVEMKIRPIIK